MEFDGKILAFFENRMVRDAPWQGGISIQYLLAVKTALGKRKEKGEKRKGIVSTIIGVYASARLFVCCLFGCGCVETPRVSRKSE